VHGRNSDSIYEIIMGDQMNIGVFFLIFAFLFGTASTVVGGEVYKWVDKDGAVHFTDSPTEAKHPSSAPSAAQAISAKRYQYLIKTAVAEYENPVRTTSDEVRVCSEAFRLLKRGMAIQGRDEEFLDVIESAIKNCKKATLQNGEMKTTCNSGEAFSLLDKARKIKGMSSRPAKREMKDRLDELEDDMPTLKKPNR
jgi:hypothetical protein